MERKEQTLEQTLLVMGVAEGVLQLEQFPELGNAEMTLHVFLVVHDAAAQCLLVRLSLENLLLDGPGLRKKIKTIMQC